MTLNISTAIPEARLSQGLQNSKEKSCQSKILQAAKLSIKYENRRKLVSHKQGL